MRRPVVDAAFLGAIAVVPVGLSLAGTCLSLGERCEWRLGDDALRCPAVLLPCGKPIDAV